MVGLDESVFKGVARGHTARGNAQLIVDGAEVGMDGTRTNNELLCHLVVGHSPGHETQDLDLPSCQPIGIEGELR